MPNKNHSPRSLSGWLIITLALAVFGLAGWRTIASDSPITFSKPSSSLFHNLQGETAIESLKQQGLYEPLGQAMVRARRGAQETSVVQQQKLTASDAASLDLFGYSVAISGDTVVVGALKDADVAGLEQGSAYVFTRNGMTWTQQQKLIANDASAGDNFGSSVGISGETIVVGAWLDDSEGRVDCGSVYVFKRTGTIWTQQQKLEASDAASQDFFGIAVGISGETIAVGARGDDHSGGENRGSAYAFVRTGILWTEQLKLVANDAAASDQFGNSIGVSGETIVVGALLGDGMGGADQGVAYIFTRTGTTWVQQQKLTAMDASANDHFGYALAVSGDTVVVGAVNTGRSDPGSAYVFTRTGTIWTQQQKLTASDSSVDDQFGYSVGVSGDVLVISSSHDDSAGIVNHGSAYVFERTGTAWTQQQKLQASDAATNDVFGFAVGISGQTIVVAAHADDDNGQVDQGAAYIFAPSGTAPLIACPADISVNNDPANQCSASVNFNVTATGSPMPGVTCRIGSSIIASPYVFPVGTTTVVCTASNGILPDATCSFRVTIRDNQPPAITCPSNITATAIAGGGTAMVSYAMPMPTDNCAANGAKDVTVSCSPPSGSSFQAGVTTVTCTASDMASPPNVAICGFTVTVVACTSITCPSDTSLTTTSNTREVTYSLPAVNGACGTITCLPASGASFSVGVTTVTCASSIGNQTCAFRVTVNRVSGLADDPLACTGPGGKVQATLNISNDGQENQNVVSNTSFTNLTGVPGSCSVTPNVGTCTVTAMGVNYSATLTPGVTATITYLTQVNDSVLPGAKVCTNNSVSFNGGAPLNFSACDVVDCPPIGPGGGLPAAAEMSGQKAGSVLVYNVYTSSTDPTRQNTRLNITNTHSQLPAFVHLFFVAEGCSVADSYVCLTPNQTTSFLASDLDPGTTGYVVAVAVDARGCPVNFNYLIGDEYAKFASGHAANLAAEAFAAITGGLPTCDGNSVTAVLNFDGVSYNRTPAVLALSNVGARADGNDTLLILNRIGGNLGIGAASLGTLFGILYDDAENALSFSVTGGCQFRSSLTNNTPRTTPRFETFIPAGRAGWLKVYNQTGAIGLTGAAINFNANSASSAGAFNQGHNLHALTLNNQMSYVIPVFPPSC